MAATRRARRPASRRRPVATFTPAVDVFEDEDGLHLFVEVPGVSQDEIDIRVEGDTLTLRGERKLEQAAEKQGYRNSSSGPTARSTARSRCPRPSTPSTSAPRPRTAC